MKPKKIVRTPRIREIVSWCANRVFPTPPKIAPKEINTALKPTTNKKEPNKTFPRLTENPAANERYPGTNGNTHGDKKEITPAINAKGKAATSAPEKICSTKKSFILYLLFQSSLIVMPP